MQDLPVCQLITSYLPFAQGRPDILLLEREDYLDQGLLACDLQSLTTTTSYGASSISISDDARPERAE